jgi:hypothetical protein
MSLTGTIPREDAPFCGALKSCLIIDPTLKYSVETDKNHRNFNGASSNEGRSE